MRTWLAIALLGSLAIVALHALRNGGPPIEISFFSLFASFSYASVACHFVLSTAPAASRKRVVALGFALGAAGLVVIGVLPANALWTGKWILVGLGGLGVLSYARDAFVATTSSARRTRLAGLRDALIVPFAVVQVPFFLWANTQINPVYDARVFAFEDLLGVPFSYLAMQSYVLTDPLSLIATACYLAIPVGLSVIALKQPTSDAMTRVLLALILAGVCGFALYTICPVVGPVQAFDAPYPIRLPALAPADIVPLSVTRHVPRNGMPSLHTVWALLIVLNARSLTGRWRAWLTAFAILNVWAAMGRYQHWFMDLVVAVPLAAAMQSAFVNVPFRGRNRRLAGCALCLAATLVWLFGLRQGLFLWAPSWLTWLAVLVTVALPLRFVWPHLGTNGDQPSVSPEAV